MALKKPYLPQEIPAVEKAFPASVVDLMPSQAHIPHEFRFESREEPNSWQALPSIFFGGNLPEGGGFIAKDGIDARLAYDHLSTILRSYEPRHEDKCAAVAFLASMWFHALVDGQGVAVCGAVPDALQEKGDK